MAVGDHCSFYSMVSNIRPGFQGKKQSPKVSLENPERIQLIVVVFMVGFSSIKDTSEDHLQIEVW